MPIIFVLLHYLLMVLFLREYYLFYFFILLFIFYMESTKQYISSKGNFIVIMILFALTPFLLEYFDTSIYYMYLFLNLENFYTPIDTQVSYILSFLHSIVFFLAFNRKKIFKFW